MMVKYEAGRSRGEEFVEFMAVPQPVSSFPWLFQGQVFLFPLSSLGRPLQAYEVWWQTGALFNLSESYRSA